jgi:hypothetical protein
MAAASVTFKRPSVISPPGSPWQSRRRAGRAFRLQRGARPADRADLRSDRSLRKNLETLPAFPGILYLRMPTGMRSILDQLRNEPPAWDLDPEFYLFVRPLEAYRNTLRTETTAILSPDSDFFRLFKRIDPDGPAKP